jgi:hypothetical protein
MPVTQPPTLNVIDSTANQFLIQFGIFINEPPVNRVSMTVPNIIVASGLLYSIDLSQISTPARGNIPAIRSLGVCLDSRPIDVPAAAANLAPIYIWNPKTGQVVSFLQLPTVPSVAYPSVINAVVPFFCAATQSIQIFYACGDAPLDFNLGASFSAFTFDVAPYYSSETVGWALQA